MSQRPQTLLPAPSLLGRVGRVPFWLFAVATIVLYVASASLGLWLFGSGPLATIWPPAALALAAFLLAGWWMMPIVLIADLAATWINGLPVMPLILLGNVLGPLVGAVAYRRWVSAAPFPQTVQETGRLLFVIAPGVALITAGFGAAAIMASAILKSYEPEMLYASWWLGDVLGLVTFTPLYMSLGAAMCGFSTVLTRIARASKWEILLGTILLAVIVVLLGALPSLNSSAQLSLSSRLGLLPIVLLSLFMLMVWAALRLPSLAVFGLLPTNVVIGIDFGLQALAAGFPNAAFVQWMVLLPALLIMAATALLIEAGTRERRFLERTLRFQSDHDPLTGLLNRRSFERQVRALMDASHSGVDHPRLLCYLDLDQFQMVNDSLGHAVGDQMLIHLSAEIARCLGPNDVLARLGGDEFGVVIEGQWNGAGRVWLESLQQRIDQFRFEHSGKSFSVRVSIGVVPLIAASGDYSELLSMADNACLTAKEEGRNRVVFSSVPDAVHQRIGRLHTFPLVQTALDCGRVELHGQNLVGLAASDSNQWSMEILCRLRNEDGTLLVPDQFIEIAERSGLMPRIDRLVVDRTLAWLASQTRVPDQCFINLSAESLTSSEFIDHVLESIHRESIDPARLVFEVTETTAIRNFQAALRMIERLRSEQCKIALDDFGTGMASLGHLHELPVDYVKVDGRFIQHITDRPINEAIVRSIARIGRDIGILTVAEWVESAETAALVRTIGLDYAQGFHFSRPQPLM